MQRRTVVLADLHLVRSTPPEVSQDLARLLAEHAGSRVVFAGDLFDLSSESPGMARPRALREALGVHAIVRSALAEHVDRGGELWLVGGNHDAEVGEDDFTGELVGALGLGQQAMGRVRTTPWFFREEGLHIEHGHLYDPDNAPAHPLVSGQRSLGVHFVEEFIAPTGAHRYLQANDQTPLKLFLSAFKWYGLRAPYVIYRYFHAAISAVMQSGPLYRGHEEVADGEARIAGFSQEAGVGREVADALIGLSATPTMESVARTFSRLYFDRVLATLAMGAGATGLALGKRGIGATSLAGGAMAMAVSWAAGHNRYAGTVSERLATSAKGVAEATGAKLVVFGHTHKEALGDQYANTGSFSFPREAPGRPFVEIEGSAAWPRAASRYFTRQAA
ncbi:metallophosphoesterase [Chondromyces crocatus]|nr:metallophosphoesterase [Chondromyces crocatus]